VKSILEQYPAFKSTIMRKLIDNFDELSTSDALRMGIWILGEYSDAGDPESGSPMILNAFQTLANLAGPAPFIKKEEEKKTDSPVRTEVTKNIVLADGTYASVTETNEVAQAQDEAVSHIRKHILAGDIFLGTVLSISCTKMALRLVNNDEAYAGALEIIAGIGRLTESKTEGRAGVHADCLSRLSQCARVLLDPSVKESLAPIFEKSGHEAYAKLIED
jgi:coatomer subunit beta